MFSCFLFFLGVSTYYLVPLLWILFVCLPDALYDTFTDGLHSHMYYMGCYTCVNVTAGWNHHLSLPRPNSYSYSKFSTQVNAVAFPVCLHVSVKLLNVVHVCYVPLALSLSLASVTTQHPSLWSICVVGFCFQCECRVLIYAHDFFSSGYT